MVKKLPSKVIIALFLLLPASAVFLHAGGANEKQNSAVASGVRRIHDETVELREEYSG